MSRQISERSDGSRTTSTIEKDYASKAVEHEDVEVDAKVYSFAPRVFRFIRAIDGIKEYDIMKSVKPQLNRMQIFKTQSNKKHASGGASGSFFFHTEDRQFIIKTITQREKEVLMQLLPEMTEFIMKTGGKSLISRIYGVYMVEYPGMNKIFLML